MIGLLERPRALGIRKDIAFDIFIHPGHDPGCAQKGVDFLSRFEDGYRHALLIFDHDGSSKESLSLDDLENSLQRDFAGSRWREDRAQAIVIVPELEAWVWSDSPHVARAIGWQGDRRSLYRWLIERSLMKENEAKPSSPKEARHAVLRRNQRPKGAALYKKIASRVSLKNCRDPSFRKLARAMRRWFCDGASKRSKGDPSPVEPC